MALIHCDFFSDVLGISTSMVVIIPQRTTRQIGLEGSSKKKNYPVLYLLHGLSDDETIWQRRTSLERYASELGLIVVMPNGGRSFYTDMAHGYNYFTFLTEELPQICKSFFPISHQRQDTFIAGLSMGGYGAFKIALSCPEKYAAAASLSGVMDICKKEIVEDIVLKRELSDIFGEISLLKESKHDLFALASKTSKLEAKPKLFQCCGTEDMLYRDNITYRDFIKKLPYDYTYEEEAGTHEWGYWDKKIQSVLRWLPMK